MDKQLAIEFINKQHGNDAYIEDELELVHLVTVQVIGSKIEERLAPGADLFAAMEAYMSTPEGNFLDTAVRNAVA